eukprot:GHVP01047055.1.p1 GENE.GHVP01047055.1~~GHVP01047055.1.p1  ORF type:complete len:253 (-),score=43.30 GHVP01047055.1:162-920(-)
MIKIAFLLFIGLVRCRAPKPEETEEVDFQEQQIVGYDQIIEKEWEGLEKSEETEEVDDFIEKAMERVVIAVVAHYVELIVEASLQTSYEAVCRILKKSKNFIFGEDQTMPKISILASNVHKVKNLCDEFDEDGSGNGSMETPYYVYVHVSSANKLFDDHKYCGHIFGFGTTGETVVLVAGTIIAGAGADIKGLELVIMEEDCDNLATCDLDGYASWTGSTKNYSNINSNLAECGLEGCVNWTEEHRVTKTIS